MDALLVLMTVLLRKCAQLHPLTLPLLLLLQPCTTWTQCSGSSPALTRSAASCARWACASPCQCSPCTYSRWAAGHVRLSLTGLASDLGDAPVQAYAGLVLRHVHVVAHHPAARLLSTGVST